MAERLTAIGANHVHVEVTSQEAISPTLDMGVPISSVPHLGAPVADAARV